MILSVIIPCYNMAANGMLNFCLDSVLNQTISDYEIICIDDCSSDNTLDILKEYQQQFPQKIKVIEHKVNKRQGGGRNSGLKIAKGDFIAFVDADDFVAPNMYEKLLDKAMLTNADCVACKYCIKYTHDFVVEKCSKKGIAGKDLDTGILDYDGKKKLILNGGSVCSRIYKRELIFNYPERFPEGVFFEDNCIMSLIYSRIKHFEFVDEALYYYYQRPNSTVKGLTLEKWQNRLNSARSIVNFAKQYNYYDLYKDEIEALFIRIFYVNTFAGMVQHYPFSVEWFKRFVLMTKEIKNEFPDYLHNPYWSAEFKKKWRIRCFIANVSPALSWFGLSVKYALKNYRLKKNKL